jgi:hypothetical protein
VYNRSMRFQVPQFIDVEDKIFGPLTFKQFAYLVGAAGVVFIAFAFFPKGVAIVLSAPFVGFGVLLAFYKRDGRPFVVILESAYNFFTRDRLYIWERREKPIVPMAAKQGGVATELPKVSSGKLKDLAWNLDVKESIYADTLKANKPRS